MPGEPPKFKKGDRVRCDERDRTGRISRPWGCGCVRMVSVHENNPCIYYVDLSNATHRPFFEGELEKTVGQEVVDAWHADQVRDR
jgi:hypothetical protein